MEKIYSVEGGIDGFYVGVVPDTAKTIADSFLFFLAYNFLRQSRLRSSEGKSKHLSVIDELSTGFIAGAFSKFLTTPIANVVTRKQTSTMVTSRSPGNKSDQDSIRSIARQIQTEKGIQGFWSGYSASLVLTLNPSLTFFFYEALKRSSLPHSKRADPPPRATFLLAAISKVLASAITYPFSLAKSRLQTSSSKEQHGDTTSVKLDSSPPHRVPNNVFATILQIARTEGMSALYEGLGGEVMKGFFSHGITMIVKEAAHKLVIHLYYAVLKVLRRYPSPQQLAEVAKEHAAQITEQVSEKARGATAKVQVATSSVGESASERTQLVEETVREGVSGLTEMGQEVLDLMDEYLGGDDEV